MYDVFPLVKPESVPKEIVRKLYHKIVKISRGKKYEKVRW